MPPRGAKRSSMYDLIKNGDLASVQLAVENDPALLDATVTTNEHTPLMYALHPDSRGQPAIAHLFIERGAKIDLQNKYGWTALMFACRYDQPDTAQLLIERGAKIDLQNKEGSTALNYACRCDQPDTAQLLIERGAKIDLQDKEGWTALMLACLKPAESHHTAEGLLRCIKLLYAAGADLNLKHGLGKYHRFFFGDTALGLARFHKRADADAFLSFVTTSKVARVLDGELEQPRSVILAFYEEGLRTTRSCSVLQHEDLVNLGMTSSFKRRLFLQHFNPSAVQLPRQSLPKRASQRTSRALRPASGTSSYGAFLTHDWGEDGANHEVVRSVNAKIRDAGKVTWFDGERLSGNIIQQITEGIENSRKVVVFITERYMHKLQSDDEDYCKEEFLAATRVRKSRNMISVIVDPTMLDTSMWRGPLQLKLGGNLYIDFTTTAKRAENFSQLLDRINA